MAEGACLENRFAVTCNGGSNPSLTAISDKICTFEITLIKLNMKKLVFASLSIALMCFVFSCKNQNAGNTENPTVSEVTEPVEEVFVLPEVEDVCTVMDDPSFIAFCKKNFDTNADGKISMSELDTVTILLFPSPFADEEGAPAWEYDQLLQSLKGIEYFPNLKVLIFENHQVTGLDVTKNPKLEYLYCDGNRISTLDVSKNPLLKELYCSSCGLTGLDVSKNTELIHLGCNDNQIPSLDVSKNTELTDLALSTNQVSSLDVSNCPKLEQLYCVNNQLTALDVSNLPELGTLNCEGNQLTSLDVSKNPKLSWLLCQRNKLTKLDLTNNQKMSLALADDGVELIGYQKR